MNHQILKPFLKLFLLTACAVAAVVAPARAAEDLGLSDYESSEPIEKTPPAKAAPSQGEVKSDRADRSSDYSSASSDEKKLIQIRADGGIQYTANGLSSATLSSSLTATQGTTFSGEFDITPRESIVSFAARYRRTSTEFASIGGARPSAVTLDRDDVVGVLYFQPFMGSADKVTQPLRFGIGYQYIRRDAVETAPYPVLTKPTASGPALYAKHRAVLGTDVDLQTTLGASMATSFTERGKTTGSYSSGFNAEFEVSLGYAISRFVDIEVAPYIQYQKLNFNGSGTRGSTNATESSTIYGLPVGLRVHF